MKCGISPQINNNMFPYASIVASLIKLKKSNVKRRERQRTPHPIDNVTKEQYYLWLNEGKCGSCGADSGEYQGICDECRWS